MNEELYRALEKAVVALEQQAEEIHAERATLLEQCQSLGDTGWKGRAYRAMFERFQGVEMMQLWQIGAGCSATAGMLRNVVQSKQMNAQEHVTHGFLE